MMRRLPEVYGLAERRYCAARACTQVERTAFASMRERAEAVVAGMAAERPGG